MQDTLCERSARRADADDCLAAGDAAGWTNAIEKSIAQTLSELDSDDQNPMDLGAVPLDGPDAPTSQHASYHEPRRRRARRRRAADDSGSRLILMAMLISALLALGMVGFAFAEGYIP